MPAACHFYSEILKVDTGNCSFVCNFTFILLLLLLLLFLAALRLCCEGLL